MFSSNFIPISIFMDQDILASISVSLFLFLVCVYNSYVTVLIMTLIDYAGMSVWGLYLYYF